MSRERVIRPLALFLAFVMCISMLPMAALAEDDGPVVLPDVSSEFSEETILLEKEQPEPTKTDTGTWRIQEWGGDTDVELQDGWITLAEDGNGFTLHHDKFVADTGKEGIAIYDSGAPKYRDSSLSFDLTVSDNVSGQEDYICVGPLMRFESGKNCEGFGIASKYPQKTSIQRNGMENGQKSETWIDNKLDLEFLVGTTYSLRLDTIGDTTTVYAKQNEEYKELATYSHDSGIDEGTYGFRIWRGGRTIKVENIERTEIVHEESRLGETERHMAYDDWGQGLVKIPVTLVEGDSIISVLNGETLLSAGSDYSLSESEITMDSHMWGIWTDDTVTLTVNFATSPSAIFTLIRDAKPVDSINGWVFQRQSSDENTVPQEGWLTVANDGKDVTIDYGKIVTDTGNEGWVIFNNDAPRYLNSTLEYDITFTQGTQAPWIAVAPVTRVTDGRNYEGFAFEKESSIQRTGRRDGTESYSGVSNLPGLSFEYDKTYHLRIVTVDSLITVYVTAPGGAEEKLTEFESPIGLGVGSYGFRIWRGGKTIELKNIQRTEIITSGLDRNTEQIEAEQWGQMDVSIPVKLGAGDSIRTITDANGALTQDVDFTLNGESFTLKKEYIASHPDSFQLTVTFAEGSSAGLWIIKYVPGARREYIWTPDQGINMWTKMGNSGSFAMTEDGTAMRVTGTAALVNTLAPTTANGEIEITFQALRDQDGYDMGALFRADTAKRTWQSVASTDSINGEGVWDFVTDTGSKNRIVWDGTQNMSRADYDIKVKVRYVEDSLTFWIDDQFANTGITSQAKPATGGMGLYVDNNGDILVKKVVFREVLPLKKAEGERQPLSIANDELTVRLDNDFPRVVDYTLNGKIMNGAEVRYNYVTINTVDYPAEAKITEQKADSVTYHVTPEGSGVTFDVKFTVLESQILEMLILNIEEPDGETVYSIGLTAQPLISANSMQTGATLDASWVDKNSRGFKDLHEDIAAKQISTVAPRSVSIPIITTDGLSASMFNNVLIGGDEFVFRAFELPNGEISAGFWNTEFMYRGVDGEKILPFPSEPDEKELYCRIAITEDNNGDGLVNWQDGANALKKLCNDLIPGHDQAARSFFHVGYNFSSGAQQPFLKVADNMKRLSNYMDGFSQQLVFKGYANEGHDSGHADYQDVNKRAGGAEDMNIAIEEADKLHSNIGIHINSQEAYPEAKMFNDRVMGDRDGWYWMDHSKIIRRYVDMLDGGFDKRLDALYDEVPGIDFVYVDCWGEDRWGEKKLIGNLLNNGCEMFGNENSPDFSRFGVWVHSTAGNSSQIHQFIFNTQKDIYQGSDIYWGGYNRGISMMSWQHHNNINEMVSQFYTNQLPQKYLMCHEVERITGGVGYFSGNITSSNHVITKDGAKLTDGNGKIFIPWYDESSELKDPDEAAKIYHWNSSGGETTWTLPTTWNVQSVYLYQTTQNGKKLVGTIPVVDGTVTISAQANTPYVVYPGEATPHVTEWSVGSPIKDTGFNSRDFSIWQKDGDANIHFQDDGNGVSILYMEGTEAGQVSQTMTGLVVGQKYRIKVDAGAENGKTARITVIDGDNTYTNYLEQVIMANQYFDDYAKGKKIQRMWVDFVATAETAELILSADVCQNPYGKVTFMESRIVKTADPGAPTEDETRRYAAYENFEYVEQGAYGIFNPESSQDGSPHLSETHLPYTSDTISGDWSLKVQGARGQSTTVRTSPATMRLTPNTQYTMEFKTQGNGKVYVQSEADSNDMVLTDSFKSGENCFTFTTGTKKDYIVRIESGAKVLDDFMVYSVADLTPPSTPANLVALVEYDTQVKLTWSAATDADSGISGYNIYRNDTLLASVDGTETAYVDEATEDETTYTYQVSAVNGGSTEGEKSSKTSVTTGILPPAAIEAILKDTTSVTVTFNKAMDRISAETVENYQWTGTEVTTSTATLSANGKTVTLKLNGALAASDEAILQVVNVKDASGEHKVSGEDTFTITLLYHYFKFDEAADAAAVDEAGRQNGVKENTASVDGRDGKAIYVNGDGYVDVASRVLSQENEFTISTWVKWAGGSSGDNCIISNDISGDGSSRGITFKITKGKFAVTSNVGGLSSDCDVTPDEWVHLALVKSDDVASLYVNGEKVITGANPYNILGQDANIRIGGNTGGGGKLVHQFKGAIDEVKIFVAPLSDTDIAVLAGKEQAATPEAVFDAATMTLSNVTSEMKYSVDGGINWMAVEETPIDLSEAKLTVADGIRVKQLGDGSTTVESAVQTITLTQASTPISVGKTDCTTAENNDGTITGVTSAMEYRDSTAAGWTKCLTTTVTGLSPASYEVRVAGEGTVLASESVTLIIEGYQPPVPKDYTVTFFADDKIVGTETVEEGGTLPVSKFPAVPTKTGHNGVWDVAEDLVNITENKTVTAIYTAQTYTVTLDANGGELGSNSVTVTYGQPYGELPEPTAYDDSVAFDGWYTAAVGGEQVTEATIVTTTADHTLYAHWRNLDTSAAPDATVSGMPAKIILPYEGEGIELTVTAGGTYTYQWQRKTESDWTNLENETGIVYTIPAADITLENSGWQYRCEVTNTEDGKAPTTAVGTPVTLYVEQAAATPVTGITLDKTELSLTVGNSGTLTAAVMPDTATNRNVVWESSADEVAAVDENGLVTAVAEGNATITVTTEDGGFTATCEVTVTNYTPPYVPPTGGGSTTETVKNEDGSTTKTVTNKTTGTVTETTTYPNGDKTVVETKKDGTVTETVTRKDGYKSETVTKPDGSFTSSVTDAGGVKTETAATAKGEITASVTLPKNIESAKITVPVKDAAPGIVAVAVNEDGTERIIRTSVVTGDGLSFIAEGNIKVKVIDNSKTFADVAVSHWAADSVQFVASRELFTGTGNDVFDPMGDMTRAMLITVLARLDGQDTEGGETWYSKAMDWGVENGITDGTNAEVGITREQLAVMLYRYAGVEKTQADLSGFADSGSISDWASDAMNWAVAEGILTGKSGGKLDPSGLASRAEVAAMLQRFIENTLK